MSPENSAPEPVPTPTPAAASHAIYCIAIGGTGMAPLAALLAAAGHRVRGADQPLYPPMSTLLAEAGIAPLVGYDPAHLEPPPDLVVIGNAVGKANPEVQEVERRGLPYLSMPQALARFFLATRRPLVVAGTHGKTTTTAMAAWVWTACGRQPSFLVGGMPRNLPASFALAAGDRFILEGDEYNASYFDRGPKFLHYQPQTVVLTSAEHDHADLYPTPEALFAAYGALVELLPEDGLLVACGDWPVVRELAARARCRVVFYGLGADNQVRPAGEIEESPAGTRWRVVDAVSGEAGEAVELFLPGWGRHNVVNALGVWAAARADGIPAAEVVAALGRFQGVARRLEEVGSVGGITVVDDFAHHPTAVATTLAGLARRYPGRRIVVLYEPRSLTAGRRFFHAAYREAFTNADCVLFAPLFHQGRLAPEEALDLATLTSELSAAGTAAQACGSNADVLAQALAAARPGDVFITMSSGAFDAMPRKLLAALRERQAGLEPPARVAPGSGEGGR